MKKILQQTEPVLRKVALEVPVAEIGSKKIQNILKEMSASLKSQDDGVAIAAPQIGYSLRIFVVSGKIFHPEFVKGREEKLLEEGDTGEKTKPARNASHSDAGGDLVFINPKISRLSRDKEWLPEGCLSVRWLYGKIFRSKKATVTAYNESGVKLTRGASGLLAQIFQHETDHLNGILFIDNAKDIKEELPK
jgi:peptide deformylase